MVSLFTNVIFTTVLLHIHTVLAFDAFTKSLVQKHRLPSVVVLNAKSNPSKISKKAEYYIMMNQFRKLKESGEGYDALKELVSDKNITQGAGYKKFVGKGTLDQRLRAIINYKRSSTASTGLSGGFSSTELQELDDLDNYDDEEEFDDQNEDDGIDDEERMFESAVLDILQKNKISALQRDFLFDTRANNNNNKENENATDILNNVNLTDVGTTNTTTNPKVSNINEEDMYTPKTSSWGVFQRPKDISKTYGGGRVITREEIAAMDAAFEEQAAKQRTAEVFITDSMRVEKENMAKIKDALARGQGKLYNGDRKGAVAVLESVKELVSWQSEFGGELLLELAMALETVDRVEEARSMYGKLASVSWSQKIRRQAIQLLQGLDITKKLRQDGVTTQAPVMDLLYMQQISEKLKEGLTNEWYDYKKKDGSRKPVPWFEDDSNGPRLERVANMEDAYFLMLRAMNSLKKVPSEALSRAFRMMYISPAAPKLEIINKRIAAAEKEKESSVRRTYEEALEEDQYGFLAEKRKEKKQQSIFVVDLGEQFGKSLNGTWDLLFSLVDKKPHAAKRFESGSLRRKFDSCRDLTRVDPKDIVFADKATVVETEPIFWGMGETSRVGTLGWNAQRCELNISLRDGRNSPAPRQTASDLQTVQVLWVDDEILVTRQASDSIGVPDLYTMWRKLRPARYVKY